MKTFCVTFAVGIFTMAMHPFSPAHSSQDPPKLTQSAANVADSHDFNFEVGEWRVHHRVRRAAGNDQWLEFDGVCTNRVPMDGSTNVEDQRFDKPAGVTHGVALRAYDSKTRQWAIWWIDSRNPLGALDPPAKGGFENGIGTFYSDGALDGRPIRTRFIWSKITPTSAHWEQAYSSDRGKTWETNWIMEFQRISSHSSA